MPEQNDMELVREYARANSQAAFAELVQRYINLVHSVAFRYVGNSEDAHDVTQAVFIILAKKADSLSDKTVLTGWLYETTRFTATNFLRSQVRRQSREQEAYMQSTLKDSETDSAWQQVAPFLEDAMTRLNEKERTLLALHFFENKSGAEAAALVGIQESAARKRIARAVEKLRKFFVQRGVGVSAVVLVGAVSANAVQTAPPALAKSISAVAMTKGATASGATLTLVKGTMNLMTWMKLKFVTVVAGSVLVVICATTVLLGESQKAKTGSRPISSDPILIVPHQSVGQVRAGMTMAEVEAALGRPDRRTGAALEYLKLGLAVLPGKDQKSVRAVMCGDSSGLNGSLATVFKGKTKEGIGVNSSRADLIQAFGEPTSVAPMNQGMETMEYKSLGLTFSLQKAKVFHIIVKF